MRLDKFLSQAGAASRSSLRDIIRAGRVSVDGTVVKRPEAKLSGTERVLLDGREILPPGTRVGMLHKPAGYVTSTADPRDKTVMELLPPDQRDLFPVGRLDKDTEGLLLLTNDGALCHRLTSPRHQVEKEYYAETEGQIDEDDILAFRAGLRLRDGTQCLPAELWRAPGGCRVVLREGKYHQVRRMLAARGKPVVYLRREREGGLTLDGLERGGFRLLSREEISKLL